MERELADIDALVDQLLQDLDTQEVATVEVLHVENSTTLATHQSLLDIAAVHLKKADIKENKLQLFAPKFNEVLKGIVGGLAALPNFLKLAAAACPHCVIPLAQVAGSLGSNGFGLSIGDGHFHADGSWHANDEENKPFALPRIKTPPKHTKKVTTGKKPIQGENLSFFSKGIDNMSFGIIGMFVDSLIPTPQSP